VDAVVTTFGAVSLQVEPCVCLHASGCDDKNAAFQGGRGELISRRCMNVGLLARGDRPKHANWHGSDAGRIRCQQWPCQTNEGIRCIGKEARRGADKVDRPGTVAAQSSVTDSVIKWNNKVTGVEGDERGW
jgi:hypothetical protein